MKTIGLIGGISWFSTTIYYQNINTLVNERLGENHSAKILLYSLDFKEYLSLLNKCDWQNFSAMLIDIAINLKNAGANCIVLCSNTPHIVADQIRRKIGIPFIHIAEETAKEIKRRDFNKVLLLGTKFTMENSFFIEPLKTFGIETIIPNDEDRNYVHSAIINELTKGVFNEETKNKFNEIISKSKKENAQAIIFGCTEISLLIDPSKSKEVIFDTTDIHSKAAVNFALAAL